MMRTTVFPLRNFQIRPVDWNFGSEFEERLSELNRVFSPSGSSLKQVSDFKETDRGFFMAIDLPGVNKKDLDVQIEGQLLSINGIRRTLANFTEKSNLGKSTEKRSSEQGIKFSKQFHVPKGIDQEKIQAHCEDGVLYLALPKLENKRPKKISISDRKPSELISELDENEK